MQKAPVLKASGLAPVEDEPIHVFGRNLEQRVVESKGDDNNEQEERNKQTTREEDVETIRKSKFDAITGEEDEETIFSGDFKLFSWCLETSNWIEKGRGQLKLNVTLDPNEKRSRLIMRTGGTYRIILNVSVKHSFFKVISHTKTNIRFTDSLTVWAASGSNAGQLADLIKERLAEDAKLTPVKNTTKASDVKPEPTAVDDKSPSESTETPSKEERPTSDESEVAPVETKLTTGEPQSSGEGATTPKADATESKKKVEESEATEEEHEPAEPCTENSTGPSEVTPIEPTDGTEPTEEETDSLNEVTNSSAESAKFPDAVPQSTSRRHSGSGDESDERELGTKKLKQSSD